MEVNRTRVRKKHKFSAIISTSIDDRQAYVVFILNNKNPIAQIMIDTFYKYCKREMENYYVL